HLHRQTRTYRTLAENGDWAGRLRERPGLEAWLECCIVALNTTWLEGDACWPKLSALGQARHVTAARARAFWTLEWRVEAFLGPQPEPLPSAPASTFLASRSISHTWEAVRRAEELSWARALPGLPPEDRCATLRVVDLCGERMACWFNDPLSTLALLDTAPVRPKLGRVMCERESLLPLARGLLERGLVIPSQEADLLKIQGKPLLNGLIGAPRSQVAREDPEGKEVLRPMILTATNDVSLDFGGDTGALPYFAQWRSIALGPDEELAWSFDDLTGAFYPYRLPDAWAPLFAFDAVFDAASLGLGVPFGGQVYLGAVAMPMGYKHAMGLVQYVHRRMLSEAGLGPSPLPRGREVRKDRSVPAQRGGSALRELWQLYCDDADYAELARRRSEPAGGFAASARDRYAQRDAPLSEKSGARAPSCQRLGALVDGRDGRVRAPPSRAALCAQLAAHLLAEAVSRKEAQVVAGHWCHLSCIRRECGTVFRRLWRTIAHWDGGRRNLLSADVCAELALALSLLPLHEFDPPTPVDSMIPASGASERGGGACWTRSLRPEFRDSALSVLAQGQGANRGEAGIIELFGGIGGGRMALERLGIEVCPHASAEVFEPAKRAAQQRWPDCVELGGVRSITAESLRSLLAKAPHLRVPFALGGSPCQGAARANAAAGGWAEALAQPVRHIPRVATLAREACPELAALPLAENASSMSEEGRRHFNRALGSVPIELCASGCSLARRPRLHWLDFPLGPQTPELSWEVEAGAIRGTLRGAWPFWAEWLESGASRPRGERGARATFTRPIPREEPPVAPAGLASTGPAARARWEADQYRYAPYQNKLGNRVYDRQGCLRPLTSAERAVRLGFPAKNCPWAVPMSAGFSGREVEDARRGLYGNTFSAPVVAMLLGRGLLAAGALVDEYLRQLLGKAPADASSKQVHDAMREGLARSVISKGSDARIASGHVHNPAGWPRRGVEAHMWQWK
ncbi:unnamed protein product, partial [Prorocentrum cordatum]